MLNHNPTETLSILLIKCLDANRYCANGSDSCFEGLLNGGRNSEHYHAYCLVFSYYVFAAQTVGFIHALCFKCEKMWKAL